MAKKRKVDVTSQGVHQKRSNRLLVQFRFNLDVRDDIEGRLADDCSALQSKRQFRPTIVKALRLFFDLSYGYTECLREFFPGIVRQIEMEYQSAEIEALRREIAELKGHGYMAKAAPKVEPAKPVTLAVKELNPGAAAAEFAANMGGFFD